MKIMILKVNGLMVRINEKGEIAISEKPYDILGANNKIVMGKDEDIHRLLLY